MTANVENGFRQTGGVTNTPFHNGRNVVTNVDFIIEPGAANEVLIRCNFRDGNDDLVDEMFTCDIWLAPNSSGFFLLPVAPDGPVSVVPNQGGLVSALIPSAYLKCVTSAQGSLQITVTDSTKLPFYFVIDNPENIGTTISRQIVTSDYGV